MKVENIDRITCLCCDKRKENIKYIKLLAKYFKLNINLFIAGNGEDPELKYDYVDKMDSKHNCINDAHKCIIRQAKEAGCKNLLVLEDDITFTRDFLEILNMINLPAQWASLVLGGRCTDHYLYPVYDNRIICLENVERVWGFYGILLNSNVFDMIEGMSLQILIDNFLSNRGCIQYFLNRPVIVERPLRSNVTGGQNNDPFYDQALAEGRILRDNELIYQSFCRINNGTKKLL